MDPLLVMVGVVIAIAVVAALLAFVVFRERPKPEEPEEPDPWETLSLGPAPQPLPGQPTQVGPVAVPASAPPVAARPPSPDSDLVSPEDAPLFAGQSHVVNLDYEDYMGQRTRRVVEVGTAWWKGERLYIRGWCRLRNDWRTFRADRVFEAWTDGMPQHVDGLTLVEHLRSLSPAHGPNARKPRVFSASSQAPPRAQRSIQLSLGSVLVRASDLDQLTAMVLVLVYLARADGRFVATEKAAVLPLLATWAGGLEEVPPALVDLGQVHVDLDEFQNALDLLAEAPEEIRLATTTGALHIAQASAGVKEDEAVVLRAIDNGLFPSEALAPRPTT